MKHLSIDFTHLPELPAVAVGSNGKFLILHETNGYRMLSSAFYLNEYPVTMEYGCGHAACRDTHGAGCPVTGWYGLDSNFDFEEGRRPILGTVISWAEIDQL